MRGLSEGTRGLGSRQPRDPKENSRIQARPRSPGLPPRPSVRNERLRWYSVPMRMKLLPLALAGTLMEIIWLSVLAIGPLRDHAAPFLALMALASFLCLWSYLRVPVENGAAMNLALAFALVFRLTLLPAHPYQSEDVYRYIWDARVAAAHIDPFGYPPNAPQLAPLRDSVVYSNINSKPYVTAYPPVSQMLFRASTTLFGESLFAMKAIFSLLEFGAVLLIWRLLRRLRMPQKPILLLAWNPFFIFEFSHSGHSDSGMLFLMAASFWLMEKGRHHPAMACYAGAVMSKLHPLLLGLLFWRRTGWKAAISGMAVALIMLSIYFTPASFLRYVQELRLYYRLFEFNAGIHYFLTGAGRLLLDQSWHQKTGPFLAATLLAAALAISWKFPLQKTQDLIHAVFWIMTADLCLATTVHPWYLSWAAFALPFFPYAFMFYWTGAAFLSYLAYQYRPVYEPSWVQAIEYLPMFGLMIWEIVRKGPLLAGIKSDFPMSKCVLKTRSNPEGVK
jgi:alpha-1,6-mannosyltransferase